MVALKTEKKSLTERAGPEKGAVGRQSRGTRVRVRCSGQALGREVEAQLAEAMPHIVRATVEQAKKGSLIHTKWLWDKAEESLKRKSEAGAKKARVSLAEMLMRELGEGEGEG